MRLGLTGSGVREVSILLSHSLRAAGSLMLPRAQPSRLSGLKELGLPDSFVPPSTSVTSGWRAVATGDMEAEDLLQDPSDSCALCGRCGDCAARRSSTSISDALGTPSLLLDPEPFRSDEEPGCLRREAGDIDERSLGRREFAASLVGEGCRLLSVRTLWDGAALRPSAEARCPEGDLRKLELDLCVEGLLLRGAGLLLREAGLLLREAGLLLLMDGLVLRGAGLVLRGAGLVLRVEVLVTRVAGLVLLVDGLDLRVGERRLGWSLRVGRSGSVRGLGS